MYVETAVQRNRIDAELSHIQRHEVSVSCKLAANSKYEQLLTKRKEYKGSFAPPFEASTDASWAELLSALAAAPARQQALRDTINGIHKQDAWTKVIVFAPVGDPFDSARAALMTLGRPVLIAEASSDGDGASVGEDLDVFSQPDIRDPTKPLVLLMSFDQSSALNLQKVSHNVIFYAPLWGEDAEGVHASSNEQQAIGRVIRTGQTQDVVLHRLVAVGPSMQKTIEQRIVDRNTSQEVTRQAVNT